LYADPVTTPDLTELARRVRAASRSVGRAPGPVRDDALRVAADLLEQETAAVLEANRGDLARAESGGMAASAQDRLRLSEERIRAMAAGLRGVATLADPVGEVVDGWVRPNGLRVSRMRVPLGVVGVIYENRPNVTSDAAGLCLKAGNAAFLRGSASALASNQAIVGILRRAVEKAGLPRDAVALVEDTSHETAVAFMRLRGLIDCLIPRGGPALIASLLENATVPYVLDGDGNCHVYIDEAADLSMALDIVVNAKTHRFGVCNAAETILVHAAVAPAFLGAMASALVAAGVELRGDERVRAVLAGGGEGAGGGESEGEGEGAGVPVAVASESDFATEFLGPIVAVGVVDDLDGGIEHIARFGSGHSEAIVTTDVRAADRFVAEVDAAAVLVNASTRFIDGEELGLGAEVGISTQKLHARGPMGVRELTSVKWVVRGDGQVRQ
jgi:glutamate-5-semialdehyde dehydrogenase